MIENEGIRVEETRSCLLCENEGNLLYGGLRDFLFGAPGIWSLMRCPNCGLVWLNPRPLPDDIGKLYSQYYTHQIPEHPQKNLAGIRKRAKASILQSCFGYRMDGSNRILGSVLGRIGLLEEIIGAGVRYLKAGDKGRLLDVGCGNGLFLDRMRQYGWDVMGVETDGCAVSVAREKFGLEVFHGSLEEAMFPEGCFDAITVNHVIEHISDPIRLLKECCRLLRPYGKLAIITPNMDSLGAHLFCECWRGLEIPRHQFLFTQKTLRACIEAAGLDVQDARTTANLACFIWAASCSIKKKEESLERPLDVPSNMVRLEALAFQILEYGLCWLKEYGEEIVVLASKKNESGIDKAMRK